MKIGLFVDKGRELMGLSMKWGGFMDGMGIFEQKNEERRGEEERKQRGGEGEREKLRRGKGRGEWV